MRKLGFAVLFLAVLLALLCVTSGAFAASNGSCGTNVTYVLDDNGVLTIRGTGRMWNFASFYNSYGNLTTTAPWNSWNSLIKYVVIKDGVTSIGSSAFGGCSGLTSVTIPGSVTSIDGAFENCRSLTSVTIPDSMTSIGGFAFENCSSLTSVTITDSVTSIGEYAFSGCSRLTSVTIPDSVTRIGDDAFRGCRRLTSVTIPGSVTSIGDYTFYDCSSLTSVTIPDSVTSIGEYAFYDCSSLTSVTIPDSVTSIGSSAFGGCSGLTSVTIPDSVTSIGNYAFSGCTKLKHIAILGDTVNFGTNCFSGQATIYCYEYTDVDFWAVQQGYQTVYLDNVNMEDIRAVTLEPDFRLAYGESRKVTVSIFPDDQPEVTWVSSNPTVVSVDNGVVTALSNGTATITAAVGNVSASVNIEVFTPATGFTLSHSETWMIAKTSLQLSVIAYEPADASAEIAWSSSDTSLADVDANGQVTTYKPGDVTVTATTEQGVSRECLIHICYPVTAVEFADGAMSIVQGCTAQLTANVTMRTQSCVNHLVTFSSSDETVATVSETGAVTAHALGTVTITATAASGVSADCTVIVRVANVLTLPASTKTIESEAFANLPGVDRIVIPAAVTGIADDAFSGSHITIIAPANSYAANWALEHGVNCITQ